MRNLMPFLKPYRRHLVIGPFFKLIEAILELILPLLIAYMIDVGIAQQDRGLIWRLGLICLLMAVTGLGCATICQYTASLASQGVGTDLRNALFTRINQLSLSDIDQVGTSSLANRLTNDVNLLQQAVAMLIRLVVRAPFLSIGGLIMAMTIDLRLSLILLVTLPLFITIVYVIMSRTIPLYRLIQNRVDQLMRHVLENLTGIRVIRAFARQRAEKQRFDQLNQDVAGLQIRVGRIANLLNPATTFILNAAIAAMLWLGAFQIDRGSLSRGQMIALTNYVGQILVALVVVANLVILYTRAYASAGRVSQLIDLQPVQQLVRPASQTTWSGMSDDEQATAGPITGEEPESRSDADVAAKNESAAVADWRSADGGPWLDFRQVSFQYPNAGAPLFEDLSFTLEGCRTVGVIGPTGAGKSTFAWLLMHLWPVTGGQIHLAGQLIQNWTPEQISRLVAIVPQRTVLFTGTIADNLRLGRPDASEDDLWEALETAQAADFVQALDDGMESQVQRGGSNFSGGQRQRLAIARALVSQPRLLILDDSTSALDYATEAALRQALNRSETHARMHQIIISQRIASVQRTDQILLLDDGDLIALGSHQALLKNERLYQEIWQSQQTDGEGS